MPLYLTVKQISYNTASQSCGPPCPLYLAAGAMIVEAKITQKLAMYMHVCTLHMLR